MIKALYRFLMDVKRYRGNRYKYECKNKEASIYLERIGSAPLLTAEEIETIDEYWKHYGIKFSNYDWFRLYNFVFDGEFSPKFIPNDIYAYIVWPYYNNKLFTEAINDVNQFQLAWRDKNYFERFLPGIPFPKAYIRKINGRFYDGDYNFISCREDIDDVLLENAPLPVVVKDTWDSGEGRGVKKYKICTADDVNKIIEDYKTDNIIVQECIEQNMFFERFNKDSVNIIRINTFNCCGEIVFLNATLRVGVQGSVTDICYINGVETVNVIGISGGVLSDYMIDQNGRKVNIVKILGNNKKIPKWDEMLNLAIEGHKKLEHFDIVGWDFTVDVDENIKCIEYNIQRPGTVFYQYANGPFFGKYTDLALNFLEDKRNQDKYIPKFLRA